MPQPVRVDAVSRKRRGSSHTGWQRNAAQVRATPTFADPNKKRAQERIEQAMIAGREGGRQVRIAADPSRKGGDPRFRAFHPGPGMMLRDQVGHGLFGLLGDVHDHQDLPVADRLLEGLEP